MKIILQSVFSLKLITEWILDSSPFTFQHTFTHSFISRETTRCNRKNLRTVFLYIWMWVFTLPFIRSISLGNPFLLLNLSLKLSSLDSFYFLSSQPHSYPVYYIYCFSVSKYKLYFQAAEYSMPNFYKLWHYCFPQNTLQ